LLPQLLAAGILFHSFDGVPRAAAQEARPPQPVWPHEGSDLQPEKTIRWGQLENGVRFAIMPNAEPPGRISLRLFVDAGSLNERDDQQGVAHFLEHMAFNGTKHFPPGEMVEYFQRLGMAFGADTNAHTSFNETVYKLELPKVDTELLDQSFMLLRDYSDRMLLLEKEIDRERGVILSEKLSRDSASYRTFVEGLKFSLPEALVSVRLPIGTEEVIKTAPRGAFLDFYRQWYTADRLAVVAVGDADPAELEKLIRKHFESLPRNDKPVADPDPGPPTTGRGFVAMLQAEPEMSYTSIGIEAVRAATPERDSSAKRLKTLREGLASGMLSRRFEILAKKEGSPILQGRATQSSWLDFVESADLTLACKPEHWEAALKLGETEIRRALEHGFTESELTEIKAKVLSSVRNRAEQAGTRQSKALSSAIVSSLSERTVFTDPRDDLARVEKALAGITVEQCHETFRDGWKGEDRTIFIGGNVDFDKPSETIARIWNESSKVAVTAPLEEEAADFAYVDFGKPGLVRERTYHADLGLTQIAFENGVRVNLKQTDFEAGTIQIIARFGSGKLTEPVGQAGLSMFTDAAFGGGGLEAHSADELDRILAGRTVGSDFTVDDDAFLLMGRTRPEDLELQLQLLCAQLTAPGWRAEGARQFGEGLDSLYSQSANTSEGVFRSRVSHWLHGEDARFGLPPKNQLAARKMEESKAWLSGPLANDYLEVSLVGDFQSDEAIDLLAKTFGALPRRAESKTSSGAGALVGFPEKGSKEDFNFETKIPRAIIAVVWKTEGMDDIKRTRRLGLLGDVFDDRLRLEIREKLGDAYSPAAYHSASDVWKGYGALNAFVTIKPESAEQIPGIVLKIAEDLIEKGITDDEFERALAPRVARLEQIRRDNGYWLRQVLAASQEQPRRLEWARSFVPDHAEIRKEELEALAREFLDPKLAVVARVLPIEKKKD